MPFFHKGKMGPLLVEIVKKEHAARTQCKSLLSKQSGFEGKVCAPKWMEHHGSFLGREWWEFFDTKCHSQRMERPATLFRNAACEIQKRNHTLVDNNKHPAISGSTLQLDDVKSNQGDSSER